MIGTSNWPIPLQMVAHADGIRSGSPCFHRQGVKCCTVVVFLVATRSKEVMRWRSIRLEFPSKARTTLRMWNGFITEDAVQVHEVAWKHNPYAPCLAIYKQQQQQQKTVTYFAHVCMCVYACVRACVHACVHACVCVRARILSPSKPIYYFGQNLRKPRSCPIFLGLIS